MRILKSELKNIKSQEDIVIARQSVRTWAVAIGLNLVDQTKIVTAASEIARNTLNYGKGGTMLLEHLDNGFKKGLRITFEDNGPGIPDLNLALQDHFSTDGGMGLGLGGTKRLVNEFSISSKVGEGTKVAFIRWK
jgi:serine/threonine-protein kinase RsbT